MAKVTMEAHGRFGQMLAAAIQKHNMSLRDLAVKMDYTYEQMRKVWINTTSPSKALLREMCRLLGMDIKKAEQAVAADRMERKYGQAGFSVMGRDPRLLDIEEMLPQLSKPEWDMFVSQIRGFVHQKRKSQ